ncbi:MAG: DUF166 domain-containing protein [Candidatus Methanogasteraceae archaeon]|uniref:Thymidylate synthase n=1 Tax=Candidatus Methanogaster sp. ANME-2c ERB4 TaxID=2759911 RepID=A0A7G9Y2H6_9EURY|nr:hypothetical protein OONBJFFA_00025 [Methanosarcinales archaeon ANME-2c ERB4]QNO43231.1 hypothetical protein EOOENEJO_00009 [Methanosarcinales archaeon ANME-2c ERB4]QNO45361.1 hypothetical protein BALIDPJP_00009 [Methanosarcinales archaeon ANME-2c ERB4]QNO45628.1 hypothetical protein JMABOEBK_00025 [Methanosarcinales archaeon ANME-2c ERB4]
MLTITVVTRGKYGERAILTIMEKTDFVVTRISVPEVLPEFIEDTKPYTENTSISSGVPPDLVIIFALHPDLTPAFAACAAESGAGAVIVSGSDTAELRKIAERYRVHIHTDEICCSLLPCGDRVIDEFASVLGRPHFKIAVADGVIRDVRVIRGSPCGASWWAASQLIGTPVADAPGRAGLLVQQYPCRAVRGTRGGIHRSAELHKKAVEEALADVDICGV